jgi:hypothetical protein
MVCSCCLKAQPAGNSYTGAAQARSLKSRFRGKRHRTSFWALFTSVVLFLPERGGAVNCEPVQKSPVDKF